MDQNSQLLSSARDQTASSISLTESKIKQDKYTKENFLNFEMRVNKRLIQQGWLRGSVSYGSDLLTSFHLITIRGNIIAIFDNEPDNVFRIDQLDRQRSKITEQHLHTQTDMLPINSQEINNRCHNQDNMYQFHQKGQKLSGTILRDAQFTAEGLIIFKDKKLYRSFQYFQISYELELQSDIMENGEDGSGGQGDVGMKQTKSDSINKMSTIKRQGTSTSGPNAAITSSSASSKKQQLEWADSQIANHCRILFTQAKNGKRFAVYMSNLRQAQKIMSFIGLSRVLRPLPEVIPLFQLLQGLDFQQFMKSVSTLWKVRQSVSWYQHCFLRKQNTVSQDISSPRSNNFSQQKSFNLSGFSIPGSNQGNSGIINLNQSNENVQIGMIFGGEESPDRRDRGDSLNLTLNQSNQIREELMKNSQSANSNQPSNSGSVTLINNGPSNPNSEFNSYSSNHNNNVNNQDKNTTQSKGVHPAAANVSPDSKNNSQKKNTISYLDISQIQKDESTTLVINSNSKNTIQEIKLPVSPALQRGSSSSGSIIQEGPGRSSLDNSPEKHHKSSADQSSPTQKSVKFKNQDHFDSPNNDPRRSTAIEKNEFNNSSNQKSTNMNSSTVIKSLNNNDSIAGSRRSNIGSLGQNASQSHSNDFKVSSPVQSQANNSGEKQFSFIDSNQTGGGVAGVGGGGPGKLNNHSTRGETPQIDEDPSFSYIENLTSSVLLSVQAKQEDQRRNIGRQGSNGKHNDYMSVNKPSSQQHDNYNSTWTNQSAPIGSSGDGVQMPKITIEPVDEEKFQAYPGGIVNNEIGGTYQQNSRPVNLQFSSQEVNESDEEEDDDDWSSRQSENIDEKNKVWALTHSSHEPNPNHSNSPYQSGKSSEFSQNKNQDDSYFSPSSQKRKLSPPQNLAPIKIPTNYHEPERRHSKYLTSPSALLKEEFWQRQLTGGILNIPTKYSFKLLFNRLELIHHNQTQPQTESASLAGGKSTNNSQSNQNICISVGNPIDTHFQMKRELPKILIVIFFKTQVLSSDRQSVLEEQSVYNRQQEVPIFAEFNSQVSLGSRTSVYVFSPQNSEHSITLDISDDLNFTDVNPNYKNMPKDAAMQFKIYNALNQQLIGEVDIPLSKVYLQEEMIGADAYYSIQLENNAVQSISVSEPVKHCFVSFRTLTAPQALVNKDFYQYYLKVNSTVSLDATSIILNPCIADPYFVYNFQLIPVFLPQQIRLAYALLQQLLTAVFGYCSQGFPGFPQLSEQLRKRINFDFKKENQKTSALQNKSQLLSPEDSSAPFIADKSAHAYMDPAANTQLSSEVFDYLQFCYRYLFQNQNKRLLQKQHIQLTRWCEFENTLRGKSSKYMIDNQQQINEKFMQLFFKGVPLSQRVSLWNQFSDLKSLIQTSHASLTRYINSYQKLMEEDLKSRGFSEKKKRQIKKSIFLSQVESKIAGIGFSTISQLFENHYLIFETLSLEASESQDTLTYLQDLRSLFDITRESYRNQRNLVASLNFGDFSTSYQLVRTFYFLTRILETKEQDFLLNSGLFLIAQRCLSLTETARNLDQSASQFISRLRIFGMATSKLEDPELHSDQVSGRNTSNSSRFPQFSQDSAVDAFLYRSEAFWIMSSLCFRALSDYFIRHEIVQPGVNPSNKSSNNMGSRGAAVYSGASLLKQHLFYLDFLIERDFTDAWKIINFSSGLSVSYLFTHSFQSLFADLLNAQLLYRVWDMLFLEIERARMKIGWFLICVAYTIIQKTRELLLKCKNAQDVIFVIKNYAAFEMQHDQFINITYEALFRNFYQDRQRKFDDQFLNDKYNVGRSFYANNCALFELQSLMVQDLFKKKQLPEPSFENIQQTLEFIMYSAYSHQQIQQQRQRDFKLPKNRFKSIFGSDHALQNELSQKLGLAYDLTSVSIYIHSIEKEQSWFSPRVQQFNANTNLNFNQTNSNNLSSFSNQSSIFKTMSQNNNTNSGFKINESKIANTSQYEISIAVNDMESKINIEKPDKCEIFQFFELELFGQQLPEKVLLQIFLKETTDSNNVILYTGIVDLSGFNFECVYPTVIPLQECEVQKGELQILGSIINISVSILLSSSQFKLETQENSLVSNLKQKSSQTKQKPVLSEANQQFLGSRTGLDYFWVQGIGRKVDLKEIMDSRRHLCLSLEIRDSFDPQQQFRDFQGNLEGGDTSQLLHSSHSFNYFTFWKKNSEIPLEHTHQILGSLFPRLTEPSLIKLSQTFSQSDRGFFLLDLILTLLLNSHDATFTQKSSLIFQFTALFEKSYNNSFTHRILNNYQPRLTRQTIQSLIISLYQKFDVPIPNATILSCLNFLLSRETCIPKVKKVLFIYQKTATFPGSSTTNSVQTELDLTKRINEELLFPLLTKNLRQDLNPSHAEFLKIIQILVSEVTSGKIVPGLLSIEVVGTNNIQMERCYSLIINEKDNTYYIESLTKPKGTNNTLTDPNKTMTSSDPYRQNHSQYNSSNKGLLRMLQSDSEIIGVSNFLPSFPNDPTTYNLKDFQKILIDMPLLPALLSENINPIPQPFDFKSLISEKLTNIENPRSAFSPISYSNLYFNLNIVVHNKLVCKLAIANEQNQFKLETESKRVKANQNEDQVYFLSFINIHTPVQLIIDSLLSSLRQQSEIRQLQLILPGEETNIESLIQFLQSDNLLPILLNCDFKIYCQDKVLKDIPLVPSQSLYEQIDLNQYYLQEFEEFHDIQILLIFDSTLPRYNILQRAAPVDFINIVDQRFQMYKSGILKDKIQVDQNYFNQQLEIITKTNHILNQYGFTDSNFIDFEKSIFKSQNITSSQHLAYNSQPLKQNDDITIINRLIGL